MNEAGLGWRIYASEGPGIGSYGWAICPTFAECLYKQRKRMVPSERVITDASHGSLPALSLVMPEGSNSQHNFDSMLKGDNWIGTFFSGKAAPAYQLAKVIIKFINNLAGNDRRRPDEFRGRLKVLFLPGSLFPWRSG